MPGRRQHGEGSVYQRGRRGGRAGQWVAVADLGWLPGGKRDRREFTGASAAEAIGKRDTFLDARRGGFTMPRGRPPYVSEWALHWLENVARPRIAPATYQRTYLHHVRDLIAPYFERVPLPQVTEEDIEAWHAKLGRRPARRGGGTLAPATIVQAHRILSMALGVAVARKRLAHNPCVLVRPPRLAPVVSTQPPGAGEVRRILARCESWPYGARWIVAIATGVRQGEALRLRWRDVQLDAGQPHLVVRTGKSEAATRAVPLPPVAVAALRAWRKAQITKITNINSDLVFTRADGRPVPQRADWQDWRDLCDDLGLPRYRVHDLRHGFATYLLEEGVDVKVVQVLIGHASPDFTRKVYQHVRPALHGQAADAMERYLRGQ